MAKNNQKLINFHGSVKANLETAKASLTAGEIAIVHNGQNDSLLATLDAKENGNLVYFITSGAVYNAITGVTGTLSQKLTERVDTLSGAVSAIIETYATSANTHSAIAEAQENASGYAVNAETNAVSSSKAYVGTISGYIKSTYDTAIEGVKGQVTGLATGVSGVSASILTYVDNKLVNVYTFKGSVDSVDKLPTAGMVGGDVYNVVAADETNKIPAGTNYAWNSENEKWDALGGSVDLSIYVTKESLTTTTNDVETLKSDVADLKTGVTANANAITAEAETARAAEKKNAEDIAAEAETARAAEKKNAEDIAAEAETARAAEKKNAEDIQTQTSRIDTLSGLTETIKSAVQEVTVSTKSNLASAKFTATKDADAVSLDLDLSTLVIDCGEF
jgi:hypothetical protein